ncbi:MAG: hypothetical protein RIB93_31065 [Coleofasciculus sp. D1-CHI-01]
MLPDLMSDREGSGGLRRIEHLMIISLIKYPPNPPYWCGTPYLMN